MKEHRRFRDLSYIIDQCKLEVVYQKRLSEAFLRNFNANYENESRENMALNGCVEGWDTADNRTFIFSYILPATGGHNLYKTYHIPIVKNNCTTAYIGPSYILKHHTEEKYCFTPFEIGSFNGSTIVLEPPCTQKQLKITDLQVRNCHKPELNYSILINTQDADFFYCAGRFKIDGEEYECLNYPIKIPFNNYTLSSTTLPEVDKKFDYRNKIVLAHPIIIDQLVGDMNVTKAEYKDIKLSKDTMVGAC